MYFSSPSFVKKHYPKAQPESKINIYGDDDWATPSEEEEITVDGGEIEVTVEPTKEQLEQIKPEPIKPTDEELSKLQNHLSQLKYYSDELYYEEDYFGDLERLTDTTQTLIVEEEEDKKDEKRTLKYRKRR